LLPDLIAGVTTGINNIPDAMASAIVVGVNTLVKEKLDDTETTSDMFRDKDIFLLTDILGESTQLAVASGQEWLK